MTEAATDFGIFRFTTFRVNDRGNGLNVAVDFVPGIGVDAEAFGMVQVVTSLLLGQPFVIDGDATLRARSIPSGEDAGAHVDQDPTNRNPLYALVSEDGSPEALASGRLSRSLGSLGRRHRQGGALLVAPAQLVDDPKIHEKGDCEQRFETACLAIAGAQRHVWYGSVTWGWQRTGDTIELRMPKRRAGRGTSATFRRAVEIWNRSRARSGAPTLPLPLPGVA